VRRNIGIGCAGLIALMLLPALALCGGFATVLNTPSTAAAAVVGASEAALKDIPAAALQDYRAAAAKLCPGLSWTVLAAIGKIESDHGRSTLPGVHSGANSKGAEGPMQFEPPTWASWAQWARAHGMADLAADVYDQRQAIYGAAWYLCSNGAEVFAQLRDAIWHYNQDWGYVSAVLTQAATYALDATKTVVTGVFQMQPGNPFGGACRPVLTQAYGPTDFTLEPAAHGFVHFHTGIDLACPPGTPIHSLTDGVAHVTSGCLAGPFGCGSGWGNHVVVEVQLQLPGDQQPTRYWLMYAHMLTPLARDGAAVHAGDIIGLEGSTGASTGAHLHFEADRGAQGLNNSVNPSPLLSVA
jgi:hypothetical protein